MSNYNGNGGPGLIPWWAIALCFIIGIWPLGIVLLILRLSQDSSSASRRRQRNGDVFQQVHDGIADATRGIRNEAKAFRENREADKARQARASAEAAKAAQAEKAVGSSTLRSRLSKLKDGKVLTIVGIALMAVFGLGTAMNLAETISYLSYEPLWLVEEVLPSFILTGVGAGLFTAGQFKTRRSKKFRRLLTLIGDQQQLSIPALASALPAKQDATRQMLENMIDEGLLGERAYIDYGRDMLILDGSAVPEPEPARQRVAPETDVGEENALLREIRQVNDDIKHPELSRKIDRIEEITGRILEFQRDHPEKAPELRKFLNYYLPTTLKILRSYAELERQGVNGENIDATKQRIEGMMDMVVEGFERQLDKLFAGDMMDIASDITVMEQMMRGDGLFQDDEHQMGGH